MDIEDIMGLVFGYFGANYLGRKVENNVRPNLNADSSKADKGLALIANGGTKGAIAFGLHRYTESEFPTYMSYGVLGSILVDTAYRYQNNWLPSSTTIIGIPVLDNKLSKLGCGCSGNKDMTSLPQQPNIDIPRIPPEPIDIPSPRIPPEPVIPRIPPEQAVAKFQESYIENVNDADMTPEERQRRFSSMDYTEITPQEDTEIIPLPIPGDRPRRYGFMKVEKGKIENLFDML